MDRREQRLPGIRRTLALIRKETRQMVRDKSTLTLGIVLPMILLLLFGFGLSLDVSNIRVAVVRDEASPVTRDLQISLGLSPYFSVSVATSMKEAVDLLGEKQIDAIVRHHPDAGKEGGERVQVIVNGRDANNSRIQGRYVEMALNQWLANKAPEGGRALGKLTVEPRIWYNDAMESRYFLVPGVIVLIMTIIGAMLTALVIAREWERGTFEGLIATPVKEREFLIGKIIPYFGLGMIGLGLCLAASYWIFEVPLRGSLGIVIAASAIYLLVSLGIGLLVSSAVKSQFLASQIVLIVCFLPTLMLSGFIFDLNSAPRFIYYFAHAFPATWYVDLLQTLFLVGNIPEILVKDMGILVASSVIVLFLARRKTRKSLE